MVYTELRGRKIVLFFTINHIIFNIFKLVFLSILILKKTTKNDKIINILIFGGKICL